MSLAREWADTARRAGLEGLVDLLQQDALTSSGRLLAAHYVRSLGSAPPQSPAVHSNSPISRSRRVVVIAGPPRSGTSLMYSLMSQVPGNISLRGWQCVVGTGRADRISIRRAQRINLDRLVPPLNKLHPISVTGPEELNQLGARVGLSLVHLVLFGVTPFAASLRDGDSYQSLAFREVASRELQTPESPDGCLLVKCPHLHCRFDDLRAMFPNALTITIRRSIALAHASWRALVAAAQYYTLRLPSIERDDFYWSQMFQSSGNFDLEVEFAELCDDPLKIVRNVQSLATGSVPEDLSNVEEAVDLIRAVRPVRGASAVPLV